MDGSKDLLRFLFIGNVQPYYLSRINPLDVKKCGEMLEFVKDSMTVDQLITLLKKNLKGNILPRHDEAMFVLAYALSVFEDKEVKHVIYDSIPEMISECKDLFLFLHFMEKLKGKKLVFGMGIKKAITKWYDKFTALELVDILYKNRKMHGFSHTKILSAGHIELKDKEKNDVLQTVLSYPALEDMKKYLEKERPEVIKDPKNPFGRIYMIHQLKNSKAPKEIYDIVKTHKFSREFIPGEYAKNGDLWIEFLPQLPYRELLAMLQPFNDAHLLKQTETFAKKYTKALGNMQTLNEAKLPPIAIHTQLRLYESKQRYMQMIKEAHNTSNNRPINKSEVNIFIQNKLITAMNHSIDFHPRIGVRFFVTLDLNNTTTKKKVFGNRFLTCKEAMILLALTLFKREKDVTIVTFSETSKKWKPIEFKSDTTFKQAMALCDEIKAPKTQVNITLPVKIAMVENKKVDVFITMVDSLAKWNHSMKPPMEQLSEYRKLMHTKMTKHIFFNLARNTQDFKFADSNSNGILEINGFTSESIKIMESFAKNWFA